MAQIIVIEDREALRELYISFLRDLGHQVVPAESAERALQILICEQVDLALCDYMLPGMNGLDLVKEVRSKGIETSFIMMTAFGEVKLAVTCIKAGAFDFLEKPIDLDYLELSINKALSHRNLINIAELNQSQNAHKEAVIIGSSPVFQKILQSVDRVAETQTTCLLLGESGTGKELFAERIHKKSPFCNGPLVTINCASIPSELLESELFGHEKGAFTGAISRKKGLFEMAQGGTVFLDEIGELPMELQPKLLRVLQDKTFRSVGGTRTHRANIRFICATNRDLQTEVRLGRFREDLYFRLSIFPIEVPPLREHIEDLEELVTHFLNRVGKQSQFPNQKTMKQLKQYSWPGNIRELENLIERASLLSRGTQITLEHVPHIMMNDSVSFRINLDLDKNIKNNLTDIHQEIEKSMIHALWLRYQGRKTAIAQSAGMSLKTLNHRINEYFPEGLSK